jgi:hypothetical protein
VRETALLDLAVWALAAHLSRLAIGGGGGG